MSEVSNLVWCKNEEINEYFLSRDDKMISKPGGYGNDRLKKEVVLEEGLKSPVVII